MLRNRKGIGTGTIMKLTLALMVASLFIGAGTVGSLGTALEEGFDSMGESTDYVIDLNAKNEDEAKTKLSQAALFVRQRAGNRGCKEDADEGAYKSVPKYLSDNPDGYEALQDTYIGAHPTCTASTSTLARGIQGGMQELGQDQEGIYSRVAFRVTGDSENDDHEINLDSGDPETWLEGHDTGAGITAIKDGSLESSTQGSCSQDILGAAVEGAGYGAAIGAAGGPVSITGGAKIGFVVGGSYEAINGARFVGTGNRWVIFVRPDNMDNRVNKWVGNAQNGGNSYGYQNRLYCHARTDSVDWSNFFDGGPVVRSPLRGAYRNHYNQNVEMTLCPGDEGYIQMNKGSPQNDAEAGADILSGAEKYPYIEITEKGSDCAGDGSSGPVTGTVTNSATKERTGGNPDVIQESGSGFQYEPANSANFDDYIVYEPLPAGDKTVVVKAEFSERGHLQIDAQEESGDYPSGGSDTVTYMNTDANNEEHLWINRPNGVYGNTDTDYETGKTYTFTLERSGNEISWTVEEEGSTIYTYSGEGNDFRRLVLESWQEWNGNSATPSLEVKEVTVEGN